MQGTTVLGTLLYAHTKSEETYMDKPTNKYSVLFKFDKQEEEETFRTFLKGVWDKYVSDGNVKGDMQGEPILGDKKVKDETVFKFKMSHIVQGRNGAFELTVPIYDKYCKNISDEPNEIGNGSKGKVAYEIVPYYMNSRNYGLSLRLKGIQVIEMKEYSNNTAEGLGFTAQEEPKFEEVPF